MLYTIGKTKPILQTESKAIKKHVKFNIPEDYLNFLHQYGYGEINNLLMFNIPDEKYIRVNFSEYMDIWEWQNETEQTTALNGLTISTSIDGDILACVDKETPYMLLPRHSQEVMYFDSFQSVLNYYKETYKLGELYFDPYYDRKYIHISLIEDNSLNKELIENIHSAFLKEYTPDKVYNKDIQPLYVMQQIGGWVYFDLIHNSAIRIKYQLANEKPANEIIQFVENLQHKTK